MQLTFFFFTKIYKTSFSIHILSSIKIKLTNHFYTHFKLEMFNKKNGESVKLYKNLVKSLYKNKPLFLKY